MKYLGAFLVMILAYSILHSQNQKTGLFDKNSTFCYLVKISTTDKGLMLTT